MTLTIDEGKAIRKAVEETGRVFQVGTQQRSTADLFLTAIAIVQSGRLGDQVNAYLAIGGAPDGGPFDSTEAPNDIDWNCGSVRHRASITAMNAARIFVGSSSTPVAR